jgi:hypothetical protein
MEEVKINADPGDEQVEPTDESPEQERERLGIQ